MATVAPAPSGPSVKAPTSPVFKFLGSSLGLKLIMAVTGVMLSGFVLVHMLGNLKVFEGAEALDAYGRLIRFEPAFLWAARLGLLTAVGLHILSFALLARRNAAARAVTYRVKKSRESSYASRTMWLTGPLLLAYIVYHVLHMTTGTVHPDFVEEHVYHNVVTGLSVPWVATFYILATLALGFHLWHGVWSMFQTLGLGPKRHGSWTRKLATLFTLVVVLGFTSVPLSVLMGWVK
ncbi:MAG: succinate dehydrogenase cytochrome b subunit [Isosphaeraceae bacterium]